MRKQALTFLALALTAACGAAGGVRVEGPAPPSESRGPVYVVAYMGDALQRPSDFALTEFSGMNGVRWQSWGGERAVGTGELSGTWCLPGCEAKGYPATITLSRLTRLERTGYYARFTVTSGHEIKDDLTDQKLEVPPR
ncbi:hypothetical protein [Nonomuraea sp. NPDC050540]|uniref:hypothetical protein n=1 Tax=Nonomuraea sp. NPDC050540 TaxID=3364367 RepID=UPI00378BF898